MRNRQSQQKNKNFPYLEILLNINKKIISICKIGDLNKLEPTLKERESIICEIQKRKLVFNQNEKEMLMKSFNEMIYKIHNLQKNLLSQASITKKTRKVIANYKQGMGNEHINNIRP